MILFNPHTEEVSIVIKGVTYSIAAGKKSVDLPQDVADAWIATHQFLVAPSVEAPVEAPKASTASVVAKESPKTEAPKAEVKPEVVVETPKAK